MNMTRLRTYADPETVTPVASDNSDRDDNNPVDLTADDWSEIYGEMDDPESFIDNDHSMNY